MCALPRTSIHLDSNLQEKFTDLMGKARHAAIVARIWNHDYLLWGKEPDEISNRLGWLKAPTNLLHEMTTLLDQVNPVLEFPATDCVLLGMGGSSLCVEVLSSVIGSAPGRPRVHVLDSTCPAWVDRVAEAINLDKTLFIVASKSGGTIEVM
ncbi:MAG: glucose-6-phosphate isomerase, partial [Candidatus Omnitrophica bacterium]|nr:glucose-6-phosphate isomerase [Candidatus Omnitrophota bacterium]